MEKKRFTKFQKELKKRGYKVRGINKSETSTFYYYVKKLDGYYVRFSCSDYTEKPYKFSEDVDVYCRIEDDNEAWSSSTLSFMWKDYDLDDVEKKAQDYYDFISGNKILVEKPEFMK